MCATPARHRIQRTRTGFTPKPAARTVKLLIGDSRFGSPRHARGTSTTYARYIGRVGALAVSLGVGVAVATNPGVGYANTDTESDSPSTKPSESQPGTAASGTSTTSTTGTGTTSDTQQV